jgi:chromate transporter
LPVLIDLFLTFAKIGLFTFGGGYAMISLIENDCVEKKRWITHDEMMDVTVIAESTPGPIAINCATYVGYTAVVNDPYIQSIGVPQLFGIFGSILATISVVWLPFLVMIWISHIIIKHKDHKVTRSIFAILRPAIIGLLAAAAISLMNIENFGHPSTQTNQFILSILICLIVFCGVFWRKWNIIYTTLICGIIGIVAYGLIGI